ncbi:MAG: adenosine deaminase [Paracoccaceae bacterium]
MTDFLAIPKIELHIHLEGAAPPALVRDLAAEQNIHLEGLFDAAGEYASSDFTSFLAAYEEMSKVFAEPASYRALTEAVLEEQAANGVIYTEIFLSPPSLNFDEPAWRDMLAAAEAGADAAEAKHGIACRFIPVIIRHHGPEKARESVEVMLRAPRGRMRGFGMAGDEREFHPRDFARPFAMMREAGFRLTAHAGEFEGPESIRAALDHLHVERLGHGVRAIEDPALVARLVLQQIPLELCPGSNVALGVYPNLAAHPIMQLRGAGCVITVSTDDPPFFHNSMADEYASLSAVHGFAADDFAKLARAALDAAFCEPELRVKLAQSLDGAA